MPAVPLPPVTQNESGEPRQIGVELELAGLELAAVADVVAEVFGGSVDKRTDYDYRVDSPRGPFRIEADLAMLRELGEERASGDMDEGLADRLRQSLVAAVGEAVAPLEVVAPPLPIKDLALCDQLVEALRDRGATGTDSGLISAFGAQLNPEAPSLAAESITRHLRAFALVYDWLRAEIDVDWSRRLTPFVDPYPRSYVEMLVAPSYEPAMDQLIDDYLVANPTRNRALDMLPMFAHIDEQRVRAAVDDERVKSRPTYHYRLPDSRVGQPEWSITLVWERWLVVEKLAADRELLDRVSLAYLELHERSLIDAIQSGHGAATAWVRRCAELLEL